MAKNLGQMKTEIWRWTVTDDTRLAEEVIEGIVNDLIVDLSRRFDFRWNQQEYEFDTTVGTQSVALPSGFSRPFSLWVNEVSNAYRITYVPQEEFEIRYTGESDPGSPLHYTIYGSNILLGPTPNAAYTLRFRYYGIPDELEEDSDSNEFLTNAWDVILHGALTEACKYLIEDKRLPVFQSGYEARLRRFLIEQSRGQNSGFRPESHEPGWLG